MSFVFCNYNCASPISSCCCCCCCSTKLLIRCSSLATRRFSLALTAATLDIPDNVVSSRFNWDSTVASLHDVWETPPRSVALDDSPYTQDNYGNDDDGLSAANGRFTPTMPTQLNSTQLLSQASKQRVVCAQKRVAYLICTCSVCFTVQFSQIVGYQNRLCANKKGDIFKTTYTM